MKKIILSLVCSLSLLAPISANKLPLIIDHDGGVDDIIAASVQLLHNPERVKAITAEVLHYNPELKSKIHCMYMMGGALHVDGNVVKDDNDGSAEWNIHNNPQAFLEILKLGIPLKLIALDATQYTPIRPEFIAKLEENISKAPCRLVYESLQIIKHLIDCGQYMFWDTLTSAVVINPKIIKTKKVKINVEISGHSTGKIFEDKNGFEAEVATWADQELFEKTVLDILLKELTE